MSLERSLLSLLILLIDCIYVMGPVMAVTTQCGNSRRNVHRLANYFIQLGAKYAKLT
jgi:hypothetical protein